jgi:hypothetical protein
MKKGRKIGHINFVAATREEARQRLAAVEAAGEQALRCVQCGGRTHWLWLIDTHAACVMVSCLEFLLWLCSAVLLMQSCQDAGTVWPMRAHKFAVFASGLQQAL